MLAEGQREGDLELLELDVKAGTVKLAYAGTIMVVGFSDQKSSTATAENHASAIPANAPPAASSQPLSAEEQAILMEVMREQNKDNPEFPPLPPTILTSADEP